MAWSGGVPPQDENGRYDGGSGISGRYGAEEGDAVLGVAVDQHRNLVGPEALRVPADLRVVARAVVGEGALERTEDAEAED